MHEDGAHLSRVQSDVQAHRDGEAGYRLLKKLNHIRVIDREELGYLADHDRCAIPLDEEQRIEL